MWPVIGTILTAVLPMLAKLVLYIIDKKNDNDQMRSDFLKFLQDYEKDIPVKLHDKYQDQLARLKKQLDSDGRSNLS